MHNYGLRRSAVAEACTHVVTLWLEGYRKTDWLVWRRASIGSCGRNAAATGDGELLDGKLQQIVARLFSLGFGDGCREPLEDATGRVDRCHTIGDCGRSCPAGEPGGSGCCSLSAGKTWMPTPCKFCTEGRLSMAGLLGPDSGFVPGGSTTMCESLVAAPPTSTL
mmetsp:Transcript_31772/g.61453  ORF Transcript_31772/g.61453 Transcript_31772/m.61453 type:complete len:165 (-) Transcript_31772:1105-1599(-)